MLRHALGNLNQYVAYFGIRPREMRWSVFDHENMFDGRWYLHRERFIIYQLAILISLAAECTATYSLSKYEGHQTNIERISSHSAGVHNDDLIAAACLSIVLCVLVATPFGGIFSFSTYPRWYNCTKKGLAMGVSMGMGASALMSTIVVARHQEPTSGVDEAMVQQYLAVYFRPPLVYWQFPPNVAWIVLLWIAFLCTVASTIIMFAAVAHDSRFGVMGPKPATADVESTRKGAARTCRKETRGKGTLRGLNRILRTPHARGNRVVEVGTVPHPASIQFGWNGAM